MNRTRNFYELENTTWILTKVLPDLNECYIYKDACQKINYVIEDIPTALEKTRNITAMPILDKEFLISFDFIPYSLSSDLSSIIHFINDSNGTGYPGVWLDSRGVLQVTAMIDGADFTFNTSLTLSLNEWSKIEISQILVNGSYAYQIKVNDTIVASKINTQVRSFKNVVLYASNPWNVSQNGSIKNVFVANNQAVLSSSLLQWSNWSSCNTSSGYGYSNRTRYLGEECFTQTQECYVYKDACQKINYVIEDIPTALEKTRNITAMPILDKEFLISFDFIPYSLSSDLSSIIHFINDSNGTGYPGVWLDSRGVLQVTAMIDGADFTFNTSLTLSLNEWSKIEISQILVNGSYAYQIKVNDTIVASKINTQVRSFKNVVLYASNPWNVSQNGSIKNVFVANNQAVLSSSLLQWSNWSSCNTSSGYGYSNRTRYLGEECFTQTQECYVYKDACQKINYVIEDIPTALEKTRNITAMPILDKEFLISFDFIPYSLSSDLSSIIHFINDSNGTGYPGVWLDSRGVLQVTAMIDGADFTFNTSLTLSLNEWSKIEISQILVNGSYAYQIKVNDTIVASKINTQVRSFKNVVLYASNPWNVSQNGSIKNVFVANNQVVLSSSLLQWSNWSSCNTSSGYGYSNRTRYLGEECFTQTQECYVYKDACQKINYVIEDIPTALEKTRNITAMPILDKEFLISFDFIPYSLSSDLSSIIHFINDSNGTGYPGVWLDSRGVLQVTAMIDGADFTFNTSLTLSLNEWSKIEISQILVNGSYAYQIKVNDTIVASKINTQVRSFKNVVLYASNPWNVSQNGSIKNVFVANNQAVLSSSLLQWSNWSSCNTSSGYGYSNRTRYLGEECFTQTQECYVYKDACQKINYVIEDIPTALEKTRNITAMPILDKEFLISFDFIPYSLSSDLSSIIHFINDSNGTGYPGVWLDSRGVLQVTAMIDGADFTFNTSLTLSLNEWSKIEISQILVNGSYAYQIKVNDTIVASKINTQVRSFKNVVLYASNPWNVSQNGSIKNVFVANNQVVLSSSLLQWSNWSSCNTSSGYGYSNRTRYLGEECFTQTQECYVYKDACQKINYVIEDIPTALEKTRNITAMPILDKEFLISFDFIPYSLSSDLSSIIHFINDSNGTGYPGVWLDSRGVLQVTAMIDGADFTFNTSLTLSLNEWSKIEISQILVNGSYAYQIKVNDTIVASKINTQVRSFKNVVLYASNPWNVSQNGSIKNVFVANNQAVLSSSLLQWSNWSSCNTSSGYGYSNRTRYLGEECFTQTQECYVYKDACQMINYVIEDIPTALEKTRNITAMPILDKEFLISFDFIPYSLSSDLSSIIHFINDSNGTGYPGVWLDSRGVLQVTAMIDGADFTFNTSLTLSLNEWSKIEISQILVNGSYAYQIKVNDTIVASKINTQVRSFKNVVLYASNPWNVSQNGSIKNVFIANNQAVLLSSLFQWSNWSSCNTSSGYGYSNRTRYLSKECFTDFQECYVYKDKCQMINYVIEDIPTSLEKTKNITEIPILDREFLISFDFIPYSFTSNLSSILHFINDSSDIRNGYPGVWLDSLGVLQVTAMIDGADFTFNTNLTLSLNEWSKIEISQILINGSYVYQIKVNDTNVTSKINTQVRSFKNVVLYASNPWNVTQNGSIKNVFVANNQAVLSSSLLQWSNWSSCNTSSGYGYSNRTRYLGKECFTDFLECYVYKDTCQMINYVIEDIPTPLKKAKNITRMPILDIEFLISFDFMAFSFNSNINSIIHFFIDTNNITNSYPGVWLNNLGVLQVSALVNGTDFIFRTNSSLPLNQWSKIEISQTFINGSYSYKIKVNDTYVVSAINRKVRSFKNVVLYASSPWNVSQNGSIKNVFVANNQAVLLSSLLQWNTWSVCNTSNGYGFNNRTRYLGEDCSTEFRECYVYKAPLWNVVNTVSMQGNLTSLNLQIYPTFIKPSNVSLEFEYFLPPFFTFTSDIVIQRFVRTQTNRIKYSFNGNFTYSDSFNYIFTAIYNNSLCPISGVFILEIPLMLSLHVETEKRERIARTFQKQVECFNNPKIPISPNQQFLKGSYGRGIYWDAYKSHIYVCMSQHYPSTKPVCYFSDDEGYLWTAMDIRIGSVLGRHSVTRELYAVHRNRKMYLVFHKYYNKWLAITNQQFLVRVSSYLDSTYVKNLEGDYEQTYTLGTYQWLGNTEGLFFRKLTGDSWVQIVKWIL
ncbi:uncharacterized protein LOC105846327 isoform X2 [Hydra vulgaris]|nr:uncharacterized protein LOC105846327 isoform X2 [Hydra vulgaris]